MHDVSLESIGFKEALKFVSLQEISLAEKGITSSSYEDPLNGEPLFDEHCIPEAEALFALEDRYIKSAEIMAYSTHPSKKVRDRVLSHPVTPLVTLVKMVTLSENRGLSSDISLFIHPSVNSDFREHYILNVSFLSPSVVKWMLFVDFAYLERENHISSERQDGLSFSSLEKILSQESTETTSYPLSLLEENAKMAQELLNKKTTLYQTVSFPLSRIEEVIESNSPAGIYAAATALSCPADLRIKAKESLSLLGRMDLVTKIEAFTEGDSLKFGDSFYSEDQDPSATISLT